MRPWELLLVCFLLSGGVFRSEDGQTGVKGDAANDFLNDKETQVVEIANLATKNDISTCDLVASCQSECTRSACSPLLSDNLTCTYVAANQNCFSDPISSTGYCNSIRANFGRSYVRTPGVSFSGDTIELPIEMQNSVCTQRKLDPLFMQLQELQNSSLYYFNFYFGSVDGTFRFYPGVEVKNCYSFDPRTRPWFDGAISVLKDVVVLLDSGFTMGGYLDAATFQTTRLAAAQNTTAEMLQTLTPNDRATVISFNSSVEANLVSPSFSVPGAGLNVSDVLFQQLLGSINGTTASTTNTNSGSNFTAAFNQAIATFNDSSPSGALKIVILFTDGASAPVTGELVSAIAEFLEQPIKLFIYEIGPSPQTGLGQLACKVDGVAEELNALNLIENPLFAVNSYFSFLARSQRDTINGTRPFWQRAYTDFGNLGQVITVAYPVMSADGSRLIGVAGIDVQIDGLDLDFRSLLDSNLVDSRRIQISMNTLGANFTDCQAYNDSLGECTNSSTSLTPFCDQDDFSSSYSNLVCCADCSSSISQGPPSRSGSSNTIIVAVILSSVLVTGGILLCLWFTFCKPRVPQSDSARQRSPDLLDCFKIREYSYETLSAATDRFSEQCRLGSGNFGTVYAGKLEDGTKVAVKKLNKTNFTDFKTEIKVLELANHNNLVALKGFCREQDFLLVYELMEKGDLNQWLFVKPESEQIVLPWKDRVVIAKGVAKGLAYLHDDLQNQQRVCHSDIKPANILLDEQFNPKVADFGMAKLYETGAELLPTGGTPGYMAPEILSGAPSTSRTDVFSYGIVLLELVSGIKSFEMKLPWVAMKVDEKSESDVIDQRLGKLPAADEEMAKRLILIALSCTLKDSERRPHMSAVVQMIEGFRRVSPLPPSFEQDNTSEPSVNGSFYTETSSLRLSKARSDRNPDSVRSPGRKTFPFSNIIKKFKISL